MGRSILLQVFSIHECIFVSLSLIERNRPDVLFQVICLVNMQCPTVSDLV